MNADVYGFQKGRKQIPKDLEYYLPGTLSSCLLGEMSRSHMTENVHAQRSDPSSMRMTRTILVCAG